MPFPSLWPSSPSTVGRCAWTGTSRPITDQVDLSRRVVDVVVAAHDMRDPQVEVVHDDAEVVGRRAVGAGKHQIVEFGVVDLDAALDLIVPSDAALRRVLEPEHRRDARGRSLAGFQVLRSPTAVITGLFAARELLRPQRVELLRSRVAAVGETTLEHVVQDRAGGRGRCIW